MEERHTCTASCIQGHLHSLYSERRRSSLPHPVASMSSASSTMTSASSSSFGKGMSGTRTCTCFLVLFNPFVLICCSIYNTYRCLCLCESANNSSPSFNAVMEICGAYDLPFVVGVIEAIRRSEESFGCHPRQVSLHRQTTRGSMGAVCNNCKEP